MLTQQESTKIVSCCSILQKVKTKDVDETHQLRFPFALQIEIISLFFRYHYCPVEKKYINIFLSEI